MSIARYIICVGLRRRTLATLLTLIFAYFTANAYDALINGIYYNLWDDNNTATVTYRGDVTHNSLYFDTIEFTDLPYTDGRHNPNRDAYSGAISIPFQIEYSGKTYTVTSIGEYAFSSCRGLTSLTLGESVDAIGPSAFYGCSSLISVIIPNSVNSIGNRAFGKCTHLISLSIPNALSSIVPTAFTDCDNLNIIKFRSSQTQP